MMDWDALYEACMSCQKCGLAETRHNVVFGEGPRDAEVMFIGEGPGEQEDLTGRPFVGRAGQLLDDMLETLHATANGAAIAAPQVGILRRLIVIDMGELSGGPLKLVNPRIIFQEGQQECEEEGCLSFPDCWLTTLRPQRVIVEAMNEEGKTILLTGSGPLAQCFSHEIDHLDGITIMQSSEYFYEDTEEGREEARKAKEQH